MAAAADWVRRWPGRSLISLEGPVAEHLGDVCAEHSNRRIRSILENREEGVVVVLVVSEIQRVDTGQARHSHRPSLSLSDNSGVPGGVIASWTLNNLPSFGFCCTAETVTATSPIPLAAGTRYWVTAAPGAPDTRAIWTNTNTLGLLADQQTLGGPFIPGTSTLSAFGVNGIVVPEPISFFLVAAGLALLAGSRLVGPTVDWCDPFQRDSSSNKT